MKVLMVIHDFLLSCRAGSELYTYYLSKELSQEHDVRLFFTIPEDGDRGKVVQGYYDGIPYWSLKKNHIPYYRHPYQDRSRWVEKVFSNVIEQFKPDLIHFQHLFNLSLGLPSLAAKKGIATCFTLHDFWFLCPRIIFFTTDQIICENSSPVKCLRCIQDEVTHSNTVGKDMRFMSTIRKESLNLINMKRKISSLLSLAIWRNYWIDKVFRDVDIFIAPSRYLQERFMRSGLSRKKIIFMRHGFNKNIFSGIKKTKSQKVRFGFVGTISVHKGIYLLIDAFNKVKGYAELKIYGKAEMHILDDLKKKIKNPNIHIMGELKEEDKKKAFADIDVLIVPSICYEIGPLTIYEAFSAHIPVITTDVVGMVELIEDGKNGFIFPVGDSEKLIEKIDLLIKKPKMIEQISSNIPAMKDIKTHAGEIMNIYYQLNRGELLSC